MRHPAILLSLCPAGKINSLSLFHSFSPSLCFFHSVFLISCSERGHSPGSTCNSTAVLVLALATRRSSLRFSRAMLAVVHGHKHAACRCSPTHTVVRESPLPSRCWSPPAFTSCPSPPLLKNILLRVASSIHLPSSASVKSIVFLFRLSSHSVLLLRRHFL